MDSVKDLKAWIDSLDPEDKIAISDGGLTLVAQSGPYYEVGGVPDEDKEEWPDVASW